MKSSPVAGKIFVANFGARERVRALSRAKLVAAESALILKWPAESKFLALLVEKIHITRNPLSLSPSLSFAFKHIYLYVHILKTCSLRYNKKKEVNLITIFTHILSFFLNLLLKIIEDCYINLFILFIVL